MKKAGVAFHCHHGTLVEFCYDYDERVKFIKENKFKEEQTLRLRLFKLIPEDRMPQDGREVYLKKVEAYSEAMEALTKVRVLEDKIWGNLYKAHDKDFDTRHKVHRKALLSLDPFKVSGDCRKAQADYYKAEDDYLTTNLQVLEDLHKELCPNCPWDGKTILN